MLASPHLLIQMIISKRRVVAYLLLFALTGVVTQEAYAHAYLLSTEPPLGSALQRSPGQLRLSFSEPLDPRFSSFVLYDQHGKQLRRLTPLLRSGGIQAELLLRPPLPSGAYTLVWRAVSASDGHLTQGIFPFTVGLPVVSGAPAETLNQAAPAPPLARLFTRWLGFAALLILVGSLFFPLLLPRRLDLESRPQERSLLWASWGLLLLTSLAEPFWQARMLRAAPLDVLSHSHWGEMQLVRWGLILALGGLLKWSHAGGLQRWLMRAFAGLLLLVGSLSSHSAALGPAGVLADWTHQLAAALWLGGLGQLALFWLPAGAKRPTGERAALLGALVSRFARLALISIFLLLVAGVFIALQRIPSWQALFSTLYGRALLAKHLLLLPILALAAFNRWRMVPRLRAGGGAIKGFRLLVGAEALLLIIVLFFAGLLTLSAPPPPLATTGRTLQLLQTVGQQIIVLRISPVRVGQDRFLVTVSDQAGQVPGGILKVWL